jgi:hypothetical protein
MFSEIELIEDIDEGIANMSNNFTLPGRLAKKAIDW